MSKLKQYLKDLKQEILDGFTQDQVKVFNTWYRDPDCCDLECFEEFKTEREKGLATNLQTIQFHIWEYELLEKDSIQYNNALQLIRTIGFTLRN
jgi:hypothetical protein